MVADCSLLGGYTLSCFAQVPVGVTKALGLRRSDAGARAAALKEPPHGRPARHTRGPRLRDEAARLERFLNTLDIYVHIQIGPRRTERNARPSPWSWWEGSSSDDSSPTPTARAPCATNSRTRHQFRNAPTASVRAALRAGSSAPITATPISRTETATSTQGSRASTP